MLTAIEMFNPLIVIFAKIRFKFPRIGLVFFIQINVSLQAFFKVNRCKKRIISDHLIKNVEIERQLVYRFYSLEKFAANWASDSLLPQEVCQTRCAESMSTSNYYPGYPFTNVEIKTTEGAQIESSIRVFTMYFWEFKLSGQFTVLS